MRIHICLVSEDLTAIELVRRERAALIPKTLREHRRMLDIGAQLYVTAYSPKYADSSLSEYLLEDERTDFVILLIDSALTNFDERVSSACFVANVEFTSHPPINYKNYLAGRLTRILKNMASFCNIISDGANEQVMLLPLRAFNAAQLRDLKTWCRNESLTPEFIDMVSSLVESLKKRRRPHRKSNYPDQYLADDEGKLFQYGLEHHAQLATGHPHRDICVLTGTFRFGKRIATDRHYNVTKELGKGTQIAGEFSNCHDEVYVAAATTHLNIFSNDYRA